MEASLARLSAFAGRGAGNAASTGADPLRDEADACLDGMAEVARMEARTAALKVQLAADYARGGRRHGAARRSPRDRAAQEMALVAEVACVLTVSERTAGGAPGRSPGTLTTALPLTLAALQAGSDLLAARPDHRATKPPAWIRPGRPGWRRISWTPPRRTRPAGCPAGELVPSRFRAKARTWRERHHPESIEARHTMSAADRRVEYTPDRDGMAWLSAHLPADTAAGIWDRPPPRPAPCRARTRPGP